MRVRRAGLRIEAKSPDSTDSEVEYDEVNKVVRVPLVKAGGRTKLVLFTCNKCGEERAQQHACTLRACMHAGRGGQEREPETESEPDACVT